MQNPKPLFRCAQKTTPSHQLRNISISSLFGSEKQINTNHPYIVSIYVEWFGCLYITPHKTIRICVDNKIVSIFRKHQMLSNAKPCLTKEAFCTAHWTTYNAYIRRKCL